VHSFFSAPAGWRFAFGFSFYGKNAPFSLSSHTQLSVIAQAADGWAYKYQERFLVIVDSIVCKYYSDREDLCRSTMYLFKKYGMTQAFEAVSQGV
jgi:hypothetical protein